MNYTQNQLKKAFDAVSNNEDWRAEIDCLLIRSECDLHLTHEAIIFYTGTVPTIRPVSKDGKHYYHFQATGYRNGPCGP